MVFLPSYAPNLNLTERLWKFFKKKVLYNQYHKNIQTFRSACINFFKHIDQYSDEITFLMSGGFEDEAGEKLFFFIKKLTKPLWIK